MANENTFTITTDGKGDSVEGNAFAVNANGALEITADEGIVAVFAPGRWTSVKSEKTEEIKARKPSAKADKDAANLSDDDAEVQVRAERSSRGENPTLGIPDPRAINGDIETGEDEKPAKGKK